MKNEKNPQKAEQEESLKTARNKDLFLKNMLQVFGNISAACESIHISRQTFYNWINNDPDFKKQYEETDYEEVKVDFVESKLMGNINKGKEISIIFFLKTKGRKRGYQEHSEVSLKGYLQNLVSQPMTPEELKDYNAALEGSI